MSSSEHHSWRQKGGAALEEVARVPEGLGGSRSLGFIHLLHVLGEDEAHGRPFAKLSSCSAGDADSEPVDVVRAAPGLVLRDTPVVHDIVRLLGVTPHVLRTIKVSPLELRILGRTCQCQGGPVLMLVCKRFDPRTPDLF